MILIIDNYDSFVHNLARNVINSGFKVKVSRNDEIDVNEVERLNPSHIILSPGPLGPEQSGVCLKLVSKFYNKVPILGVCLGHQVIAKSFGGEVFKSDNHAHGIGTLIKNDGTGIFKGLPNVFQAGRYHSLVVSTNLPEEIKVCATINNNEDVIMGIRHILLFMDSNVIQSLY